MPCYACQNIHFKPPQELTREEKTSLLTDYEAWPVYDSDDDYDEKQLSDNDINSIVEEGVGLKSELFYVHHPNLQSLQEAADNGCDFCCQLYKLLEQKIVEQKVNVDDSMKVRLSLKPIGLSPSEREQNYRGALSVDLGGHEAGEYLRLRDKHSR